MSNYYPPFGHFNADSIALTHTTAPSSDSQVGLLYFVTQRITNDATARFYIHYRVAGITTFFIRWSATTGILQTNGAEPLGVVILNLNSASAYTTLGTKHHVLMAWDLSAATAQLYIDDAEDANVITTTNDLINWFGTTPQWNIGVFQGGSNNAQATLSNLWLTTKETLDISSAANRALFYDGAMQTLDLGSDGSGPTGTAPDIYFRGEGILTGANAGTMGDFTLAGQPAQGGFANLRPDWMAAA